MDEQSVIVNSRAELPYTREPIFNLGGLGGPPDSPAIPVTIENQVGDFRFGPQPTPGGFYTDPILRGDTVWKTPPDTSTIGVPPSELAPGPPPGWSYTDPIVPVPRPQEGDRRLAGDFWQEYRNGQWVLAEGSGQDVLIEEPLGSPAPPTRYPTGMPIPQISLGTAGRSGRFSGVPASVSGRGYERGISNAQTRGNQPARVQSTRFSGAQKMLENVRRQVVPTFMGR